ncbi:type VI immunity family protein, partial [Serratia marcescens]|uniref:type VI immunity family protein n=1 Tax=Serratia marcescens TaxID=615 RepID=UPI0011E70FB4
FELNYDGCLAMGHRDLQSYIGSWIQRHPGIMSPDPDIEALWSSNISGLTSVGWITLLGVDYCNRMGGVAELQQKAAAIPDVQVTPFMEQGAMLCTGETPQLGDTMKNDFLDNYRAVGQVLQPLHQIADRLATDYLFVTGIEDTEASKKWFNRFFDSTEHN